MTERLVATCWTTSQVRPLDVPETSPHDVAERVRAVAEGGWYGMGLAQEDLRVVRDTLGFTQLRALTDEAGLRHVEVELLTDWEHEDGREQATWDLLLDAADALSAPFVKVGAAHGPGLDDLSPFVRPLRRLAAQAADRGTRVALEPMPFTLVASVPAGAALAQAVGTPAFGLLVDAWHVFRAGTSLAELRSAVPGEVVFGVELNDCDEQVVGSLFDDTLDRRRLCGQGDQDLAGLVDVLRGTGFDGPWGVEILSLEHRALPLDEALAAVRDTALRCLAAPSLSGGQP